MPQINKKLSPKQEAGRDFSEKINTLKLDYQKQKQAINPTIEKFRAIQNLEIVLQNLFDAKRDDTSAHIKDIEDSFSGYKDILIFADTYLRIKKQNKRSEAVNEILKKLDTLFDSAEETPSLQSAQEKLVEIEACFKEYDAALKREKILQLHSNYQQIKQKNQADLQGFRIITELDDALSALFNESPTPEALTNHLAMIETKLKTYQENLLAQRDFADVVRNYESRKSRSLRQKPEAIDVLQKEIERLIQDYRTSQKSLSIESCTDTLRPLVNKYVQLADENTPSVMSQLVEKNTSRVRDYWFSGSKKTDTPVAPNELPTAAPTAAPTAETDNDEVTVTDASLLVSSEGDTSTEVPRITYDDASREKIQSLRRLASKIIDIGEIHEGDIVEFHQSLETPDQPLEHYQSKWKEIYQSFLEKQDELRKAHNEQEEQQKVNDEFKKLEMIIKTDMQTFQKIGVDVTLWKNILKKVTNKVETFAELLKEWKRLKESHDSPLFQRVLALIEKINHEKNSLETTKENKETIKALRHIIKGFIQVTNSYLRCLPLDAPKEAKMKSYEDIINTHVQKILEKPPVMKESIWHKIKQLILKLLNPFIKIKPEEPVKRLGLFEDNKHTEVKEAIENLAAGIPIKRPRS